MYQIIDKRGSGKTSRLMLLAKENNGTIVCSNPNAMKYKSEAYGITGVEFISYFDFLNKKDLNLNKYYIDELDSFLKYAYNEKGTLDGYTISLE
jgi:hypothetical protein